jgi:hypothetical protein
MSKLYLRGFAQRAEDDTAGPIRFVVATEGKKADGLDLRMDGLNLDRFRANPVVMYGHDYRGRDSLPIGRAENIEVDGPNLLADTIFDPDDEFAQRVEGKYRGGFLNAVSVGFDIRAIDPETGVVNEWEMIEYSAVPVPLDPDAVVESGRQRAIAFATALTEARDGGALDSGNRSLVEEAIETLSGLLSATEKDDDEPRGLAPAAARLRVEQMQRLAAI